MKVEGLHFGNKLTDFRVWSSLLGECALYDKILPAELCRRLRISCSDAINTASGVQPPSHSMIVKLFNFARRRGLLNS
jgi:hypothetical protein